jgi:threonine dehydrogenase-like Zn-dependent dehydrogenase
MTTPDSSYEQWVLEAPGKLARRLHTPTRLDRDWVRVGFLYCGLCGSDLSKFDGHKDLTYPISLGHEFLAEVIEAGNNVTSVIPGDIVTSDLNFRCGSCDQCRAGRSHLCRDGKVGLFSNRAFAEFGDIHECYLLRLDGPAHKHLALVEPLSCVLHGEAWASPQQGDRVLVIGAGSLGSCMAFVLCNRSAGPKFEITDKSASRLSLIAGAIGSSGTPISEPTGEYDVVFDLSGSESGLRDACEHVIAGGRLCSMSHLDGRSTGEFLLPALTRRDVAFKLSYLNGERDTMQTAARLLAEHWSPAWEKILEVVPLERLPQAFEQHRESPWCKTIVKVSDAAP